MLGLAVSIVIHVIALLGVDPGSQLPLFWLFQLLLFVLLLPLIAEVFHKRDPAQLLRAPRPLRRILFALVAYYGINFYVFLFWSIDNLNSTVTWRMLSSGWILLLSLAAVYYHVRWSEARPRPVSDSLLTSGSH